LKNKKFILELTPNGKATASIQLKNQIDIIDNKDFFKNYKISNFFKGKYFIKRLIKKIFKHQLKSNMLWDFDFWEKIIIYKFETKINISYDINNFEQVIVENTLKKRTLDIKRYKNIIDRGMDLGCPLFITSKALNYLGGKLKNDTFIILDGSRRIISNILCQNNPNVLIIDVE